MLPTAKPLMAETVTPALARERLDRAVSALCPAISRTRARKLVEGGSVFVDGQRVRVCSRGVHPGQVITCYELAAPAGGAEPRLVLEPPELAIYDKPAGMPVEPTRSGALGTLVEWAARSASAFVTHRLDTPTSGLIVVARTRAAQAEINQMLQTHAIRRRYLAVVAPAPEWAAQRIDQPLDGRPAVTQATVLARSPLAALLAVELETGRTRQIRRHLAALGVPILGDPGNAGRRAARLCLHAHRLDFSWRGAEISARAPAPADLGAELGAHGLTIPQELQ